MPAHLLRLASFSIAAAALLAACGGGGGDGQAAAGAPTANATANAAAASEAASATCGLPDFQAAAMARINQWRLSGANCGARGSFGPAAPLAWNTRLTQAAQAHSADMAAANFFEHAGSNGSTAGARVTAAGYAWSRVGENIAAGHATVNAVVDGWIGSPGHCANLLAPAFTEVGLACVPGTAANTSPTYWTMELAAPL